VPNAHDTAFFLVGVIPVSPQLRADPPKPTQKNTDGLTPGLTFRYFTELPQRMRDLPDFAELTPAKTGTTAAPSGIIPASLLAAKNARPPATVAGGLLNNYKRKSA